KLKLAWQYAMAPTNVEPGSRQGRVGLGMEAVPLVANGVMYTPTGQRTIVALEPETGKEIWRYEAGRAGTPLRGVTYWTGDKDHSAQIMAGTTDGKLIALNARTGTLVPGFGNEGVVDLRPGVTGKFPDTPYHMSSPGAIYKNLII